MSTIQKIPSKLNYDYKTIRLTQSRIDKGLLAIPKAYSRFLPSSNRKVKVYFDDSNNFEMKNFTSYLSSTNENRIGGLRDWFNKNKLKDGDQVILQAINKEKNIYRIISENKFIKKTNYFQKYFDTSDSEAKAGKYVDKLSDWLQQDNQKVFQQEYLRLSQEELIKLRNIKSSNRNKVREKVPANIRIILGNIYKGHCQVCSFMFLKKNRMPYFEIHHLYPQLGHHPKNLILVCANCHRQFEYAYVKTKFNEDGWLTDVKFNENDYHLNQAILSFKKDEFYKSIYL